jgi:hypothetical protein
MENIKIFFGILFVFGIFMIIASETIKVDAQVNSCVLRTYSKQLNVQGNTIQGGQGTQYVTLALTQQAAQLSLTEKTAEQYGKDVVECDLKCRGKVTDPNQNIQCQSTPKVKWGTSNLNCNVNAITCTASQNYKFTCGCSNTNGGGN